MSLKPVDIDEAMVKLKSDASTPEMRLKARTNLNVHRRSSFSRYGLVGASVGIAAFVFWPRVTAGTTWAQALASSSEALVVHYKTMDSKGTVISEEWAKGDKTARVVQLSNGKLFLEWRTDGKKTFHFSDFRMDDKSRKNPNYRLFGEIYTGKPGFSYSLSSNGTRLDDLLKLRQTKIVKQEPVMHNELEATKYELQSQVFRNEHYYAIVDKKSGLIVEVQGDNNQWKATYDYPGKVDDQIFEPRAQLAKGIDVYDIKQLKETLKANLEKGLATSKGVTLRSATMDSYGNLWVLWTGSSVTNKLEHPFTVSGVQLSPPSSTKKFTSHAAKNGKDSFETTSAGARIYGMSRTALTKIGSQIDISIPTKNGVATFKNIPVVRIGFFQSYRPWSPKPSPPAIVKKWTVPNNHRQ